ncbi:hypothetical protein IP69_11720 [Bosea sp. AAP35]|uniref:hypothetical protein n=1 Tax=Bosea sp. AAP35 TaxID=1523417 RepID=UPI0006B8EB7B|nr:hypothetical protein [Bosea sp. AAP35]KPF68326.1 hypothetical protein IP69_11720 [Bosea sp. AAP35]
MILYVALLLLPVSLAIAADTDPVANPIFTCKFEAGQIVIEQAEASGDVTVEVKGQARPYVMDKLKLVPRDQGLPSFLFQPDMRRWQWLNDQGEPIESVVCAEKPALKAG